MIDAELVERTWQEAAQIPPRQAAREMEKLAQKQPNLLAYVMAHSDELEPQARELAIYLFFVVTKMFEEAAGGKLAEVSEEALLAQMEASESFFEGLANADEKFLERATEVQAARQPFVMQYVVEAILEAPDEDPPLEISEDDEGFLFLILKTVVDALDQQLASKA